MVFAVISEAPSKYVSKDIGKKKASPLGVHTEKVINIYIIY